MTLALPCLALPCLALPELNLQVFFATILNNSHLPYKKQNIRFFAFPSICCFPSIRGKRS